LLLLGIGAAESAAQTKVNVRFKPGTTTGKYNGSIRGERYIDYVITGKAEQTLRVQLQRKSGAAAYFNVQRASSPEAIAGDARETISWRGVLSENGSYIVRVYMAKADRLNRKNSTFQVSFSIEVD